MMSILKSIRNYTPAASIASFIEDNFDTESISVLDLGSADGSLWIQSPFQSDNLPKINVTLLDAAFSSSELAFSRSGRVTFSKCPGRVPHDLLSIPDDSFDLVTAIDLIEHLEKGDGYRLLYEMDRISVNGVSILFTPSGFLWQPPALNNPFNAHISGWTPWEVRRLGWSKQTGLMGFRFFLGPYAKPKWESQSPLASWLLGRLLSLSQLLARRLPTLAHAFLAIKVAKNPRIRHQASLPSNS